MSLNFTLAEQLTKQLEKLALRDKQFALAVRKKIIQITSQDKEFLNHFKNLHGNLKEYKRVHIGSYVLLFKLEDHVVIFDRLLHHDEAYE